MSDRPSKGIRYFNMGAWPVYCGFTTDEKAFQKELKRLGIENGPLGVSDRANATAHFLECKGTLCFIIAAQPFNARKMSREQYAALVAHEAVHIVQWMKEELSPSENMGKEAEAYLVQQIVQESLQSAWGSTKVRRTEP